MPFLDGVVHSLENGSLKSFHVDLSEVGFRKLPVCHQSINSLDFGFYYLGRSLISYLLADPFVSTAAAGIRDWKHERDPSRLCAKGHIVDLNVAKAVQFDIRDNMAITRGVGFKRKYPAAFANLASKE